MIEVDEASRATFDEITAHPFFSDLDLEKISRKEYRGTSTFFILTREYPSIQYTHSPNSSVRERPALPTYRCG